jgi:hypothetical protein
MATIQLSKTNTQVGFKSGDGGWGAGMALFQRTMDALVMPTAVSKAATEPPATNAPGDMFVLPQGPGGAWSGKGLQVAIYVAGDDIQAGWIYVVPREGWRVWVSDEDKFYTFNGTAWVADAASSNPAIVGFINEAASSMYYGGDLNTNGKVIRHDVTGPVTAELRSGSDFILPVGSTMSHRQVGAGQVTLVPGANTFNVPTGFVAKTARKGSVIMWHYVGNGTFDITGDLAAA